MKRFLFCIIGLIFTGLMLAQFGGNRYVSRRTQDGTIFFIDPIKLKDLSGIKSFEYDMTLLSWTDSATINFTFECEKMTRPSEIWITSGDKRFDCQDFSPLFIDIKKDHFQIRITSKYPNSAIQEIISSPTPPLFCISQEGNLLTASYKANAWKKERSKLTDIYNLYIYSK